MREVCIGNENKIRAGTKQEDPKNAKIKTKKSLLFIPSLENGAAEFDGDSDKGRQQESRGNSSPRANQRIQKDLKDGIVPVARHGALRILEKHLDKSMDVGNLDGFKAGPAFDLLLRGKAGHFQPSR